MSERWQADLASSLRLLMRELIDGGSGEWVFVTDGPKSGGVRGSVGRIAADGAFVVGVGGRSAASLVCHLRYSSELFARGLRGDHSGYETADWVGSWDVPAEFVDRAVSDAGGAWRELCEGLLAAMEDACSALSDCEEWEVMLTRTGAIGNVCHYAYHLAQLRSFGMAGDG